ncbi:MAG: type II secretion system F family protein [Endomicrobia bacterium]|nr:type II secretion system F family protein [Endomicrobiia bacterium]MCL2799574.1 type II secretion system F family protein [Endomicrobiia bacterium]
MPKFKYQAIDSQGKNSSGVKEAANQKEVISALKAEGLFPVKIEETSGKSAISQAFSKSNEKSAANRTQKGKVKLQDVALFCRQLATLVNAGVSVLEAIEDISGMTNSVRLSYVLKKVGDDLRGGEFLSSSLRKYKKEFSNTLIAMVSVGEASGKLASVLADLALYLENNLKLIRKVKAASTYPMVVGAFFVVVLLVLVLGIIPKFEEMFASFGADLPLPTQVVMGISRFALSNLHWITLGTIAFTAGFIVFKRSPGGRMIYDQWLFKIPIFGKIYIKIILARFFQTLSTLVKSGVDIIKSLEISLNVVDNVYIEKILATVKERVLEGNPLGDEMSKLEIFPKMVTRMTAVGEKSGQLDAMFDKITEYYNDEVDGTVASLSSIVEPVLIIGLGIMVGIAVVAMYLPIFSLAGAMMSGQGA